MKRRDLMTGSRCRGSCPAVRRVFAADSDAGTGEHTGGATDSVRTRDQRWSGERLGLTIPQSVIARANEVIE